jgi:lipopolysaccharide transport system permease protein
LIKLVVLLGLLLAFRVPLTWMLPLSLVPMVMLVLLGICLGLFVTPFGMLYTDVATALPVVTQLFFFVTPVVYAVPNSFPFSLIGVLNPVSPLLMAARDLMTKGVLPNPDVFVLLSVLTLLGSFVGLVIYRMSLPIIIERISA